MQIDVDFEVFKKLTMLRETESDSYNAVIRRLLDLDMDYNTEQLLGNSGAWFNGVHFPEGTEFRATYKGQTYTASISNGRWTDASGNIRTSPSDAATRITVTNVNGWRFWHALLPGEAKWKRLDEFRT